MIVKTKVRTGKFSSYRLKDWAVSSRAEYRMPLSEDGVVIEMFAVFLGLLAILAFGLSLQLPTNQASALRAHHALQTGSAAGVWALNDKDEAADKAYKTAAEIITNGYIAESGGIPSGRFSSDLGNFTVLIPNRRRDGATSGGYFIYRCNGATCSYGAGGADLTKPLAIASRIFDMNLSEEYGISDSWGTYDHKNAVFLYAEADPLEHSVYKDGKVQPIVSVARLSPVMTYVLVDTAMSMSPQIYNWMFGAVETDTVTPTNSGTQWPVVHSRPEGTTPYPQYYTGSSWEYPPGVGIARYGPRGEAVGPLGDAQLTNHEVRNFFASYCFNSPWDLYKGAAVDMIDWLTTISAFDYTSGVGIVAPIRSRRDLNPAYTVANTPGGLPKDYSPVAHWDLPAYDGGGPESATAISVPFLFDPFSLTVSMHLGSVGWVTLFQGWIKSFDPYDTRGANRQWDPSYNSASPDATPGVNMWSAFLCRAFVSQDTIDGPAVYTLNEDRTSKFDPASRPEPVFDGNDAFDYRRKEMRQRASGAGEAPTWRRWVSGYHSWLFHSIALNDSGTGGAFHGPRNFIAGLGPYFNGIQEVIKDVAGHTNGVGNWTDWKRSNAYKPGDALGPGGDQCMNTYGGAVFASNVTAYPNCNNIKDSTGTVSAPPPVSDTDTSSRMATGWRNIPSAMRAACDALATSKTNYMSNGFFATERPVGSSKLVIFSFGLFSPITSQTLYGGTTDSGPDVAARKGALADALNYCSCSKNIEVIFNFLPLTPWDKQTVLEAAQVVKDYQALYNHQCKPMYFPAPSISGCSESKQVQFFVSEPTDFNDPDALVEAAIKFRENTQNLKSFFLRFVYSM